MSLLRIACASLSRTSQALLLSSVNWANRLAVDGELAATLPQAADRPLLQILEVKDDQDQAFETVGLTGSSGRISNHLVKVPFDLDRPLSAQVESAAKALRSLQEQLHGKQLQRRLHREKWPLYLRVIDARDAGETWETIGRELLKRDPDSISEDLPVDEFDRQIDRSGNTTAARARQVWEQAQVLMFNFPD